MVWSEIEMGSQVRMLHTRDFIQTNIGVKRFHLTYGQLI